MEVVLNRLCRDIVDLWKLDDHKRAVWTMVYGFIQSDPPKAAKVYKYGQDRIMTREMPAWMTPEHVLDGQRFVQFPDTRPIPRAIKWVMEEVQELAMRYPEVNRRLSELAGNKSFDWTSNDDQPY